MGGGGLACPVRDHSYPSAAAPRRPVTACETLPQLQCLSLRPLLLKGENVFPTGYKINLTTQQEVLERKFPRRMTRKNFRDFHLKHGENPSFPEMVKGGRMANGLGLRRLRA